MTDVSHELGSLRHIVDTSLSSKVAMFNKQANQHKENQLLNPFSGESGRRSPKPSFNKDEYGKPLAGSLTEARGQKANLHVLREMLELCQIIDSEGYAVKDEPTMRVIPFGELFNIYNYISDKVVGICLRARKHKLIEFEGEMLFQRRDDDVPIFLLKPIKEIRQILDDKTEDIKRGVSPAPQATSVLMDKRSRSVSPNVGKSIVAKDATANVPVIREILQNETISIPKLEVSIPEEIKSTQQDLIEEGKKEEQEAVKIEEKSPKNDIVVNYPKDDDEEKDQKSNEVTTIDNDDNKLQTKESTEIEETQMISIQTTNNSVSKNIPQPNIVVQDEENNEVKSEEVLAEEKDVSENSQQEKPDLITASSSVIEIVEEVVESENKQYENDYDPSTKNDFNNN